MLPASKQLLGNPAQTEKKKEKIVGPSQRISGVTGAIPGPACGVFSEKSAGFQTEEFVRASSVLLIHLDSIKD